MKKKILYSLLIVLAVFVAYTAYVINNPVSPLETVSSDDSDVSITYSRPFKNDRLIFGNESHGINKQILEILDKNISVPSHNSSVESLNVSVAFGIILSEIR